MANLPLLLFGETTPSDRTTKKTGFLKLVGPSKEAQIAKFDKRLTEIEKIFQSRAVQFSKSIKSLIPEMILVFEIAGTINEFFTALEKTTGLKYLLEFYEKDMDSGSGFFYKDNDGNIKEAFDRRFFVTLTNQQGIKELLRFWKTYKDSDKWDNGTTKFRDFFNQLTDIRPYSLKDRIRDTGFEQFIEELRQQESGFVNFEIEFAYHEKSDERNKILQEVNILLEEYNGEILQESITVIEGIKYFGAVAQTSIFAFDELVDNSDVSFLQYDKILYFKPVGQSVSKKVDYDSDNITVDDAPIEVKKLSNEMVVALLDGYPLQRHSKLNNRLVIDDPDDLAGKYAPKDRVHGTSMSSLIINGNLNSCTPIQSRLYVRPILEVQNIDSNETQERLPDNRLAIDIIHRAVKRMFEGDGEQMAVAPSVKIVNFSIGDSFRPFINIMSTWSKLIDYLSNKYNVLFIISSGNYTENVKIDCTLTAFEKMNDSDKQAIFYKALFHQNYERKILTPSESINALTVGGLHKDSSVINPYNRDHNVCTFQDLPSPVSRIGYGFNRSLKPEILYDCGRIHYRVRTADKKHILLQTASALRSYPPGIQVAIPGEEGELNTIGFSTGTSNATALISNKACKLHEILEEISRANTSNSSNNLSSEYYSVLIKTLLVHYADDSKAKQKLESILNEISGLDQKFAKEYISQNIGYGIFDDTKAGFCTDSRVTLIGFGKLKKEQALLYRFPLPDALRGKKIDKKITITLAWFSPLNFDSGKYKIAHLYFDNITSSQNDINLHRTGSDLYPTLRGTLQHDVVVGDGADAYIQGTDLIIKVNCRHNANGMSIKDEIRFGLAVTLELTGRKLPIYQEIKNRLRQRIRVR